MVLHEQNVKGGWKYFCNKSQTKMKFVVLVFAAKPLFLLWSVWRPVAIYRQQLLDNPLTRETLAREIITCTTDSVIAFPWEGMLSYQFTALHPCYL